MPDNNGWTINYANVNDMHIIFQLIELRRQSGLTQTALAQMADINTSHLAAIESFDVSPTLEEVAQLSHTLGYRLVIQPHR